MVDDGWVSVSGTTGYDYATMRLPDGVVSPSRPAATMIVAGLMDPAMLIEIELTARRPSAQA